jgi:hypothetical protein
MMKRKPNGDLKVNPVVLNVGRIPPLVADVWNLQSLQSFFPPIETLFRTEHLENVRTYGIKLRDQFSSIVDESKVKLQSGVIVPIHRKTTMLLNPFKWMKGEYGTIGLPTYKEKAEIIHKKLQSTHTAGYVGCIISIMLSESECEHFPKVYGVYTGTSKSHTIDISDDYEDLTDRNWFSQNIGKTFELKLNEHTGAHIEYSRSARKALLLGEQIELDGVEIMEGITTDDTCIPGDLSPVFKDTDDDELLSDSSSSISTSYIFEIESVGSSDIDVEEDEEPEEEDEPFAWATFQNVPVQVTVMEQCTGTLYDLLIKEPDSQKHYAWLAQIVFALAFAQRNFAFTHNDLHGNNVMYVETSKKFLYYTHVGIHYVVPTYGYLLKIIDFDRGISSVRLVGMKEPKTFMSDQFAHTEEAGGQYNVAPFYHPKYQTVKPNPSFDLVRLATSLFWDLFPNGPKYDGYSENPVYKLFMRWLTLSDGKSILFFQKNPKIDRYMGFNLYKAIARYCKDSAVPRKEIDQFKQFIGVLPAGTIPLLIDV